MTPFPPDLQTRLAVITQKRGSHIILRACYDPMLKISTPGWAIGTRRRKIPVLGDLDLRFRSIGSVRRTLLGFRLTP